MRDRAATTRPVSADADTCGAFQASIRRLRRPRASNQSLAVCLTGQLRLFMISLPALIEHALAELSADTRVDFFHVGPADGSFAHGRRWLQHLPGLQACFLYAPALRFASRADAPIYEEVAATNRSSKRRGAATATPLRHHASRTDAASAVPPGLLLPSELSLPVPSAALPSIRFGLRATGCTEKNARSRLVQAWQARRCLRLVEAHEAAESARRGTPWRYDALLRVRADALPTRRLPISTQQLRARLLARPAYTPLDGCPPRGDGRLAHHDFALLGRRDVMGTALRAIDELEAPPRHDGGHRAARARPACDFERLAGGAVRRALPHAECVDLPGGGGAAVASVRGNVRDGCFFLDVESPPNDGEPQPRLPALGLHGAADVARRCLGLEELRDFRRPGDGAGCRPRGGWDGDFRTAASPWDQGPPNQGAG